MDQSDQTNDTIAEQNAGERYEDIFKNLFASIMQTKLSHSVPNIAMDEILYAVGVASQKSNAFFKKLLIKELDSCKNELSMLIV